MTGSLEKNESYCFIFPPKGKQGANENNGTHTHVIFQKQFLSKYVVEDKQNQFASECTLDFYPQRSASLSDINN